MKRPKKSKAKSADFANGTASQTTLEARFLQSQPYLTANRQRLLRDIIDNSNETYYLSSREMAERYKVDTATIVRTVQALGYNRFADFTADLRKHFVTRITPYTVLKSAVQEERSVADYVYQNIDKAIENLHVLRNGLDAGGVISLAERIHRSRRIVVVGVDLAASLAHILSYGLSFMGFNSEAPVATSGNLLHKIKSLNENDLLIAVSFGQCLKETVEAVKRARESNVPTFGITDSETTPLARYCDAHLIALTTSPSFINCYSAPTAAITAILVACAHIDTKRSLALLEETNQEYKSGERWYREKRQNQQKAATQKLK